VLEPAINDRSVADNKYGWLWAIIFFVEVAAAVASPVCAVTTQARHAGMCGALCFCETPEYQYQAEVHQRLKSAG